MNFQSPIEYFTGLFIEVLLLILIVFSPLFYGSVTILPLSIIEAISFLILFIFLLKLLLEEKFYLIKPPALFLFLLLPLIFLQLLPLSSGLLSFLSPATANLFKEFKVNSSHDLTLSIYPESTLNLLLQFLSYLAIFFVLLNYIDTKKKVRRLISTIIIFGFLYAFYGIIRRNLTGFSVDFSTFTNRNHFAAYLEMIVFLCISYSLIEIPRSVRVISIFMASVMIITIFLTISRAGRISFIISLLIFLLLLNIKKPIKKTTPAIIILFLFVFLFIGGIGGELIVQRLETLSNPFEAYAARFQMLQESLKIIGDFPIFGTGLGTFIDIAQKYKSSDWQVTYEFSHNEPVQLLVELGIAGFIFVLLFLFFYFRKTFLLWFRRRSPFSVFITLGCVVGIFSISLHSFFDFIFHIPAITILFFVILALTYRAVYMKEPQELLPIPKYEFLIPKGLRIFFIILSFFLLISVEALIWKRYQAEAIFEKIKDKKVLGTDLAAIMEYKRLLNDIERTINLYPSNAKYFNKKADLLSEIALNDDVRDAICGLGEFESQKKLLELAEGFYKKAVNLNPTRADFHVRLSWIYGILNKPDLSRQEFSKALLLDPQNTKIRSYIEQYNISEYTDSHIE